MRGHPPYRVSARRTHLRIYASFPQPFPQPFPQDAVWPERRSRENAKRAPVRGRGRPPQPARSGPHVRFSLDGSRECLFFPHAFTEPRITNSLVIDPPSGRAMRRFIPEVP